MWERFRDWCAAAEAAFGLAPPTPSPSCSSPCLRVCFNLSETGLSVAGCRGFDLVVAPAVWHRRCDLLLSLERLLLTVCSRRAVTAELVVIAPCDDGRVRALLAARHAASCSTQRGALTVRLIDSIHDEAVEGDHPTSNGDSRGERK